MGRWSCTLAVAAPDSHALILCQLVSPSHLCLCSGPSSPSSWSLPRSVRTRAGVLHGPQTPKACKLPLPPFRYTPASLTSGCLKPPVLLAVRGTTPSVANSKGANPHRIPSASPVPGPDLGRNECSPREGSLPRAPTPRMRLCVCPPYKEGSEHVPCYSKAGCHRCILERWACPADRWNGIILQS